MKRGAKRPAIGPTFHRRGGRDQGQEELTMAPIFLVCKIGVFKFDQSALQWKEKTFRKKQTENTQSIAQAGRATRFMGGGQTKEEDQAKKWGSPLVAATPAWESLAAGSCKIRPGRCWSPYRGPHRTEKTENRHGTADTHTHTPTSLFSFVGFHLGLATITYVLPTTNTYLT